MNNKSFIIMSDYGITFKSDLENQEILIQQGRFVKAAYIGHRGWVSIHDPEDWEEMAIVLKEGYLLAAPKRLVKQVVSGGS
ncbi:MmcQ/YjbR family DNA-binding protein [Paenibacillus koleovorans]|uniref:MmcQ/YjbR family DNA-binding protein n=1 Tax=Paenibacillus koleovorans TaxID=121608 RepID=UPI001FE6C842|nr:MmcQ/YjbR family DNA-binding protein [Paenibacillus koleovorans]